MQRCQAAAASACVAATACSCCPALLLPKRLTFAAKRVEPLPLTLPAAVRRCCDAATAFLKAKCQCDQTLLSALPPTVVTPAGLNGTLQVCTDAG